MATKEYQKLFDTKHLNDDLKKRSLKSGAITVTSRGMMFFIQLGSTMILARILSPEDYGMMAMVVAITGFAGLFINLGLSTATIQREDIDHNQVSTLFWINTGIGALVMLLVAVISPGIAWFYQTPELKLIAIVLSLNFLFNGLAVQHQALLNRQMRFLTLAIIQVGAMFSGIVVAILVAIKGFGYWALVLNSITVAVFTVIGSWLASGWRPGLPRRDAGVGEMVRFGSDIVGFNVISYFSRNLDNVLIGRFHGSAALGFYSKAYQLLMMPIINIRDPLMKVAMPSLSRLQKDPFMYRQYYMKFLSILSFVCLPLISLMYVVSDQIINFVLGQQWKESSEIFQILAFVALIQPLSSTKGIVLLSTGKSRKYLILGAINSFILCLSFVIGIKWGAKGVAYSYAISSYLLLFPLLYFSFKNTPISVKDFFICIYKPFFSCFIMALTCYFVLFYIKNLNDIFTLILITFVGFFTYIGVYFFFKGGFKEIMEYLDYVKIVFLRNKNK